ncbi:MAG: helix-turn-helix transcriptional regulator [Acidobacteriota bacterium]
MQPTEYEVHRYLTLLRNKIRDRGFTQLQVQEALGWGRSYISQLLTQQKCLRIEQVLQILSVIGTDPAEFFAELYPMSGWGQNYAAQASASLPLSPAEMAEQERASRELTALLGGLLQLLAEKRIVTREELAVATLRESDE